MERPEETPTGRRYELFKMEYERAAARYENVYRAVWQNFSYMTVVAGAIIAFGAGQIRTPLLLTIALVPIVFWFFATFLPLDRYGNLTRLRLAIIEEILNDEFLEADPGGRKDIEYDDKIFGHVETHRTLQHYSRFHELPKKDDESGSPKTLGSRDLRPRWRVRNVIIVAGTVVTATATASLLWSLLTWGPVTGEQQPMVVELRDARLHALQDSVAVLNIRVDSLVQLLRASGQLPSQ